MKRTPYLILVLVVFATLFASCGEDRTHEYYEKTEENQWTYSKMMEVYLWRDKITEPKRTTFFSTTKKFFNSLIYSGDKVSYFTDTISAGSYGVTFTVMRDPIRVHPNKVYALALMVEPGSPADIAGIKRGTWISSVGGYAFTTTKYSMLQSGGNTNLVTETIEFDDETQEYYWEGGDTLQMNASVNYTEKALYLDSIYTVRSKNIGYLVLNNFNGDDFTQQTQDALQRFAEGDADEVIIDLRYCGGGSIANAASLASSFVPSELHGTPFCILADAENEIDTTYCYTQQQTTLEDKKLYLIIGNQTTGVAELFATALNKSLPMYDLLTIGAKSAGANVMTEKFESPYGFSINPATNQVLLADSTLLQAMTPDYAVNELKQLVPVHELGSEQEYMLFNIFYLTSNGMLPGDRSSDNTPVIRKECKDFTR